MLPKKLQDLEFTEAYGRLNRKVACTFCHAKNCVRTRASTFFENGIEKTSPNGILYGAISRDRSEYRFVEAHCMNCGNDWKMFPNQDTQQ